MGEAIAVRFAEEDIHIVIFDVEGKKAQLQEVVKQIEAKGRQGHFIVGDVSKEESVKAALNETVEKFGGLDIMVANAGVTLFKPFLETNVEDFNKVIEINALGVMLCFKHAAEIMIKQGRGGRIIGASSGAGKKAVFGMAAYSASKFAVRGLTQAIAQELRPHKITVNSYAPGFILTPMVAHPDDDKYGGHGAMAKMASNMPADLEGAKPNVIAELVAYLIKPEAYFVNGQTINIDGGLNFD